MTVLPDELVPLKRFHGHLGPYVVIGYRMGLIARQQLQHKMQAVVFSGRNPPMSCLADGVQFSSGCTLGKNNIQVREGHVPVVHFTDQSGTLEIRLLEVVRENIDSTMSKQNEEDLAVEMFLAPEADIFSITRAGTGLPEPQPRQR